MIADTESFTAAIADRDEAIARQRQRILELEDLLELENKERQLAVMRADRIKREWAEAAGTGPFGAQATELLEFFREHVVPQRGRAHFKVDAAGDNFKLAVKILRRKQWTLEQLQHACLGLALAPYVVDAHRVATGKPKQRYADLPHAIGNDDRIRRNLERYEASKAIGKEPPDAEPAKGSGCSQCPHCWREAVERNRNGRVRRVRELLTALNGKDGGHLAYMGGVEFWPCPRCDLGPSYATLGVRVIGAVEPLVWCEHCNATEDAIVLLLGRLLADRVAA